MYDIALIYNSIIIACEYIYRLPLTHHGHFAVANVLSLEEYYVFLSYICKMYT